MRDLTPCVEHGDNDGIQAPLPIAHPLIAVAASIRVWGRGRYPFLGYFRGVDASWRNALNRARQVRFHKTL